VTNLSIGAIAYSIQSAKPGQSYGQLARLPLQFNASAALIRTPLDKIPAGASVTSAVLTFYSFGASSGSFTYNVSPLTSGWSSKVTWTKRPTTDSSTAAVTKTGPADMQSWAFDLTAEVQAIVSGTAKNYGWQLWSGSSTKSKVRGTAAAIKRPVLTVSYTTSPDAPSNLHPASGAVTVTRPMLSFDADDETNMIEVQIDPAQNSASPAWDSGSVAATGGLLDLASTTYPGINPSDTTYWRARQHNGYGWSAWSEWVSFTGAAPTTLSVTNPAAGDIADGTPPVQWTVGVHTQTAWRVRLLDGVTGDVIANSGKQAGTDNNWTPPKGLGTDGQAGVVEVTVWDDQDHAATATDPGHVQADVSVTLNLDGTIAPVTGLEADVSGPDPVVVLTGNRSEIPDQVDLFRDGTMVARFDGADVFTGTAFTITDTTAPMNVETTYRVAPRVNGKTAKGGPTATVTPQCIGIWLLDKDDPTQRAAIWTGDDQDQSQPEISVVHQPLSTDTRLAASAVRRRLVRFREEGAISGQILDVSGLLAADSEAFLRTVADNDAGHLYRLILGNASPTVIVGDLTFSEAPTNRGDQRVLNVSFSYWGQDEDV